MTLKRCKPQRNLDRSRGCPTRSTSTRCAATSSASPPRSRSTSPSPDVPGSAAQRMGFLAVLARVNAAHPWSHNDAYARFVLRHARGVRRRGGDTAVDVGCGTGNLLSALSEIFPTAIGIEPDPDAADAAARRFSADAVQIDRRRGPGDIDGRPAFRRVTSPEPARRARAPPEARHETSRAHAGTEHRSHAVLRRDPHDRRRGAARHPDAPAPVLALHRLLAGAALTRHDSGPIDQSCSRHSEQ